MKILLGLLGAVVFVVVVILFSFMANDSPERQALRDRLEVVRAMCAQRVVTDDYACQHEINQIKAEMRYGK